KIAREPANDGEHVVRPMPARSIDVWPDRALDALSRFAIRDANDVIGPRFGRNAKATVDGAEKAPAASVVSVLAEEFDASGDPKFHQGVGAASWFKNGNHRERQLFHRRGRRGAQRKTDDPLLLFPTPVHG